MTILERTKKHLNYNLTFWAKKFNNIFSPVISQIGCEDKDNYSVLFYWHGLEGYVF